MPSNATLLAWFPFHLVGRREMEPLYPASFSRLSKSPPNVKYFAHNFVWQFQNLPFSCKIVQFTPPPLGQILNLSMQLICAQASFLFANRNTTCLPTPSNLFIAVLRETTHLQELSLQSCAHWVNYLYIAVSIFFFFFRKMFLTSGVLRFRDTSQLNFQHKLEQTQLLPTWTIRCVHQTFFSHRIEWISPQSECDRLKHLVERFQMVKKASYHSMKGIWSVFWPQQAEKDWKRPSHPRKLPLAVFPRTKFISCTISNTKI